MKHIAVLVLALVAACGQGSGAAGTGAPRAGGDEITSFESAANHASREMEAVSRTLAGVKDEATAEAAKPKLDEIAARLDAVLTAVRKLDPPTEEERAKTAEKMKKGTMWLSREVNAYTKRAAESEKIGQVVDPSLAEVQNRLRQLRNVLGG